MNTNTTSIMAKAVRAGHRYYHRGTLKTVKSVVILTNTVNITFEDGSTHFLNRGRFINLV